VFSTRRVVAAFGGSILWLARSRIRRPRWLASMRSAAPRPTFLRATSSRTPMNVAPEA